jgi:translation initiation factor 3 subunit J
MSDWEDLDAAVVLPTNVPGQWDDEDVEEDVLDSWDQEEDSKKVKEIPKKSKKVLKKKEIVHVQEPVDETLEEKKKRLINQELKADLENAQDLFAGIGISSSFNFETSQPKNMTEFDDFKDLILKKFSSLHGPLYINFIENLIRDISIDLSLDDTRKIVSTLNAMINEKQKAQKDSKKKKSSKKVPVVAKGLDTTNYDDVYDEFDDFM